MTTPLPPDSKAGEKDDAQLVVHHTGGGCMAWRMVNSDAPGYFALITDEGGSAIPSEPDNENLTIAIFSDEIIDPLQTLEIDGRSGLNRWYKYQVGYSPDEDNGMPLPIEKLIYDVASFLLVLHFNCDRDR
jgi:hypothetical protein